MGFIPSASTIQLSAYFTQKARSKIADYKPEEFVVSYFTLHDDDVNYLLSDNVIGQDITGGTLYNTLPTGFIPDVTGDIDSCIKSVANGIELNKNFITGSGMTVVVEPPVVIIQGCTNPEATNYNPNATLDDGSCLLPRILTVGFENTTYNFGDLRGNSPFFYNPIGDNPIYNDRYAYTSLDAARVQTLFPWTTLQKLRPYRFQTETARLFLNDLVVLKATDINSSVLVPTLEEINNSLFNIEVLSYTPTNFVLPHPFVNSGDKNIIPYRVLDFPCLKADCTVIEQFGFPILLSTNIGFEGSTKTNMSLEFIKKLYTPPGVNSNDFIPFNIKLKITSPNREIEVGKDIVTINMNLAFSSPP
jgi:hypothetical protein